MFKSENVLRLDRGKRVMTELANYCRKKKISSAIIFGMLGSVENVRIAKLTQDTSKFGEAYDEFAGPFSVIAGQGSISTFQDKSIIHIHISLAKYETYQVIGGHLVEADVLNTAEIYVGELGFPLKREIDPILRHAEVVTT